MDSCIHLRTTMRTQFYSKIFKKSWQQRFLVSLYLPIVITSVPGRGDKSTPVVKFAPPPRRLVHFVTSMNRSKEMVDNRVGDIVTEALSGGEVKAEVDSRKYSAHGRLLGCGGEAAK